MSDDGGTRFDPRFSPAFQRGFDPNDPDAQQSETAKRAAAASALGRPIATAESLSQPAMEFPSVVPVAQPVQQPATPRPVLQSWQQPGYHPDPRPYSTDDTSDGVVVMGEVDAPPAVRAHLRNPWLISLAVLALLLVVVGVLLYSRAANAYTSNGDFVAPGDYVLLEASLSAAPLMILLGAATAIGVLFVVAVRWRPRA
ncbi:hypothetical protein [Glaciihabitans sp. dw_435]|uniref:hypothetical protein n=1 Tax=Glaciihabitans sp. dw_435 TaxID=2720081 RepID=UPI001BD69883|nr:hypothetical protein [Glaciihabitans sp. dw_435]